MWPRSSPGDASPLQGLDRAKLARDAYTYLHLPMVAGIVLFALGLKTTLRHVGDELDLVPAVALCGGPALYLLAHVGFLYRSIRRIFRRRTIAAIILLALVPVATVIPSFAALALVSGICALVVAYEAIGRREFRVRLRDPGREGVG
jgi:low temperature requirement protein LtrA